MEIEHRRLKLCQFYYKQTKIRNGNSDESLKVLTDRSYSRGPDIAKVVIASFSLNCSYFWPKIENKLQNRVVELLSIKYLRHPIWCSDKAFAFVDGRCNLSGYSKVRQFDVSVVSKKDICTFDVSMHFSSSVKIL
jgi:hypothetical protein